MYKDSHSWLTFPTHDNKCSLYNAIRALKIATDTRFLHTIHGRSQDLVGGAKNFFFQIWKFACREAMHFDRGGSRKFFLKWSNLVRFGVNYDPILSLKLFEKYRFFI